MSLRAKDTLGGRAALDDAGLAPADVDGLVTFTMDTSPEITVAQACGMGELSFFSRVHYGGGAACATVQQAALAVAAGVAEVVVCYRAFNERSGAGSAPASGTASPRRRAWRSAGCSHSGCSPRPHGWRWRPSAICTPTG